MVDSILGVKTLYFVPYALYVICLILSVCKLIQELHDEVSKNRTHDWVPSNYREFPTIEQLKRHIYEKRLDSLTPYKGYERLLRKLLSPVTSSSPFLSDVILYVLLIPICYMFVGLLVMILVHFVGLIQDV